MRVEAIKISDGFLIPIIEGFREIRQNKILLDIQILDPVQTDEYASLDRLVGLCETEQTDASMNHDAIRETGMIFVDTGSWIALTDTSDQYQGGIADAKSCYYFNESQF